MVKVSANILIKRIGEEFSVFKVIRFKSVVVFLVVLIVAVVMSVGIVRVGRRGEIPKPQYTIVIDAGHGGRDDGCSGVSGTKESDINLKITKTLQNYLENLGINVVLTRSDGNGLYKSNAENYKQSDMEKRIDIIEDTRPDMVISIHQNSFGDASQRGAQAFYQEGDEESIVFAESIQTQLLSQLEEARREPNKGDYYLLKECNLPAVIVECGYLTNAEDERLLRTEEYQSRVAYAIMCGVVKYFDLCGND